MTNNNCYGSFGWKEFNQNRENILNEFDRIKALIERRPIKTAHGVAVEAYIRNWLAEFLPKKYAVTSGYVIPDVYDFDYKLYHYDVIIYNQIESPILWVEGNLDESDSGKYRAIPAKYVVAIYEVKSTLDKKNAIDSINKLNEIRSFADHLPHHFSSGSIFIELKRSDISKKDILPELFKGNEINGYWGGVILRCEIDPSMTGLFAFGVCEGNEEGQIPDVDLAKPIDELNIFLQEDGNLTLAESGGGATLVCTAPHTWSVIKEYGTHYSVGAKLLMLNWSHSKFSEFAIQLIGCMEGIPYDKENRPKYGQVFDSVIKKPAEMQGESPIEGLPFLIITPSRFEDSGDFIQANIVDDFIDAKFKYEIKNIGDETAIVSTDGFNTTIEVDPGKKRYHIVSSKIGRSENNDSKIEDFFILLENEKFNPIIKLKLVYRPQNDKNQFFQVLTAHEFTKKQVKLIE